MYQYSIQKRVFFGLKSYEICINNYSYVYIKYVGLSQWYKLTWIMIPLFLYSACSPREKKSTNAYMK